MRLAIFLLAMVLLSSLVHAQSGVRRCIDSQGRPLFTDQPCAALDATAVTPADKNQPAPSTTAEAAVIATPPPVLCAASVDVLKQSVLDAFSARDPNRLAGLMVWDGAARQTVVAHIRALGALMRRPLLDIAEEGGVTTTTTVAPHDDLDDLPNLPALTQVGEPPLERGPNRSGEGHALIVQTAGDDGSGWPNETRFPIVRRSGCLWLRSGR